MNFADWLNSHGAEWLSLHACAACTRTCVVVRHVAELSVGSLDDVHALSFDLGSTSTRFKRSLRPIRNSEHRNEKDIVAHIVNYMWVTSRHTLETHLSKPSRFCRMAL